LLCRLVVELSFLPLPHQLDIGNQHQQLYLAGDFAGALAMDEVVDVARSASKTWPEGANVMMTVRGRVLHDLGQYPESIAVLEEGLAVSKIVYPVGEPNNLHNQANACAAMGKFQRAIQLYKNAIELKDLLGNTSSDYIGLGKVYSHLGQHTSAQKCFEASLEIALDTKSLANEAAAYNNLAPIHVMMGNYWLAIELQMKKALPITVQLGGRKGEGKLYQNVAWVLLCMGEHQRSLEMSAEALIIAREVGDILVECAVYDNLSTAYMMLEKEERELFNKERERASQRHRRCHIELLSGIAAARSPMRGRVGDGVQRLPPGAANVRAHARQHASGKSSRLFHNRGYENVFFHKSTFFHSQKYFFHTFVSCFILLNFFSHI
jgi:tetratricopeptide (TPR) repeat protein